MLDFAAIDQKRTTIQELTARLTPADLAALTNEMIDAMQAKLAGCEDADVVFVPVDPEANDTFAANAEELTLPWTLGHVVVHVTASSEEAAFLAAELARGVELHGRSRYEVAWPEVTTVAQCRERLEESRRMRLASLQMWPDAPHYETVYVSARWGGEFDARARFCFGLWHDFNHLNQIDEIVRQAREARAVMVA